MATEIEWRGRRYSVENYGVRGMIRVTAPSGACVCQDELEAVRWLTCRSLRKGKARALVAAEMVKRDELTKQVVSV